MSEFDESNLEQSGSWSQEAGDNHSITGRARIRAQLEKDIAEFLGKGGQIEEVDTSFRADAPRKVDVGFNNRSL